jgi:hypothetical protein
MSFLLSMAQGARAAAPALSRRAHTFAYPTVVQGGQVLRAGHIQLQFTQREQAIMGAPAAFGHSPVAREDNPQFREIEPASGQLFAHSPAPVAFRIQGVHTEAKPLGKDRLRTPETERDEPVVTDHGEMSASQIQKILTAPAPKVFETSGKRMANCVWGYKGFMEFMGARIGDIATYTTPQEMAEKTKDFKFKDLP